MPTYILPTGLTEDEMIVYNAIRDRFVANFMPPAEFENTDIKTDVDGRVFQTKGKVLKSKGYLEVYNKEDKSELLPFVEKGEEVDVLGIAPVEKQTTPPNHTQKIHF